MWFRLFYHNPGQFNGQLHCGAWYAPSRHVHFTAQLRAAVWWCHVNDSMYVYMATAVNFSPAYLLRFLKDKKNVFWDIFIYDTSNIHPICFIAYLTQNAIFYVKSHVTNHEFWGLLILKSQQLMLPHLTKKIRWLFGGCSYIFTTYLKVRFQINSNGFSKDRSFGHN